MSFDTTSSSPQMEEAEKIIEEIMAKICTNLF